MTILDLGSVFIGSVRSGEKLLIGSVGTQESAREVFERAFLDLKKTASVELVWSSLVMVRDGWRAGMNLRQPGRGEGRLP